MGDDGQTPVTVETVPSRFYRWGAFVYRRRRRVLVAWIVVLVASFPFVRTLSANLSSGGFEIPGSQSDRVAVAIEEDFTGQFEFSDTLVLHSETLTAQDPEFREVFQEARTALLQLGDEFGVGAVVDVYAAPEQAARFISADGHTLIAQVGLTDTQDGALDHTATLEEAVAGASAGTEVRAILTGDAPFYAEFTETTTHDLERAERVALPISLIILIFAFGSLVAAGMPLTLALVSLAITFGIMSIVAGQWTMSVFAQNIASMIGLGVGIDYSLFLLTRFREEQHAGHDVGEAVARSMATSGKAVFVSALTVVLALSGTVLVNIQAFRSMGIAAMIAVAVAGAAGLTLLPALLGMFGKRVDSLRIFGRKRVATESRVWHRWALAVMRRPWLALFGSVAIIALLAFPARNLVLGSSGPSILPEESTARQASEIVAGAFGDGAVSPIQMVYADPRGVTDEGLEGLLATVAAVSEDPEIVRVDWVLTPLLALNPDATAAEARAFLASPLSAEFREQLVAADGERTLLAIVTTHGPQTAESDAVVERLRASVPGLLPPGVTADLGGSPGLNLDINEEVQRQIVPVVALVMVLSFLLLMLFFRSVLLPLKAILMNTASVVAAYGVLVFVFQEGHWEGLLGFESNGHIESFLPLFLFSTLFGLSMDYEVFLLARIREEYLRTGDNTEAVGWGLEHTARIITSAAAIMVTVFGAFAFARLLPIKTMGFGLAVAVLLDATLIRVVMVPATMRLMGKWNWWLPKWLDRILPKVSIEEASAAPPEKVPAGV